MSTLNLRRFSRRQVKLTESFCDISFNAIRQGEARPKRIDSGHKKKKTKVSHIKTPTLTEEVCITHFCVHLEMFQTTCLYVNVSGDCCSFKAPRGQPILTGLHGRYGSEPNLVQVLTSNTAS